METKQTSKDVLCFDASSLASKPVRTPEGFLTAAVNATRVGIFIYHWGGKPVKALRLPDEIFDQRSMETLGGKPITNHHPPALLSAEDAKKFMVGSTGQLVERDGDILRTTVSIFDAKTIEDIESGLDEVSCGYLADVDFEPGIHPQYGPYEAIQRNIRYNHLAVAIESGRGGSEVKVLMDSALLDSKLTEDSMATTKIKLGDKEYEVPTDLSDALTSHLTDMTSKHQTAMDKLLAKAQKEKDDLLAGLAKSQDDDDTKDAATLAKDDDDDDDTKDDDDSKTTKDTKTTDSIKSPALKPIAARIDRLLGKIAQYKKEAKTHMDSMTPAKLAEAVKSRAKLVATAMQVIDSADSTKLFAMDELEIKKAVVKAKNPEMVLDAKSADFVDGMFQAIAEGVSGENLGDVLGAILLDAGGPASEGGAKKGWVKQPLTMHKG